MTRDLLRDLADHRGLERAIAFIERLDTKRRNVMRVLGYDRVSDATAFERQMQHLAQCYEVISIDEVIEVAEGGDPLPPRAVLLTFDADRSFTDVAWPILRRHRFSPVLFIAASPPNGKAGEPADWNEMRALSREGVALGTHSIDSFNDLERIVPFLPRLFAYPPGRFNDELVEIVRAAGVELAFTMRAGANDLRSVDRLRLRRIPADTNDSLNVFRAKLALASARWSRVRRLVDPPSRRERSSERAVRVERARVRFFYRSLDAVLTAGMDNQILPSPLYAAPRRRSSRYERVRNLVRLATATSPALARGLRRALVDAARLPFDVSTLELLGYGTGATVFGLKARTGDRSHVLKTYRRTVGRAPATLVQVARRHRARQQQLRDWFGEIVMPGHFMVLHGPLRGQPVVGCLQEFIGDSLDPLSMTDDALLDYLRSEPDVRAQFISFARQVLEVHDRGYFPDLLGPGNLLVVNHGARPCLRLIDYGVFDLRVRLQESSTAAVRAVKQRFEALLHKLAQGSALGVLASALG